MDNVEIYKMLESERLTFARQYKYSTKHYLLQLNEIKTIHEPNTPQYVTAYANWIIAAKLYTAIKKIRFIKQTY